MSLAEILLPEFDQEMGNTRKTLGKRQVQAVLTRVVVGAHEA